MPKIQDGYQNEFLFVLEFNNKQIKELNPLLREVIDDLFPNYNEELIIKSWRNHNSSEKADIFIKVNNQIKTISIKKGSRNSIHTESLDSFKKFLSSIHINKKIIKYYESFHYGIDKTGQNKILNSTEYNIQNEKEIKEINKYFSLVNIDKIIDRFILRGNNSLYPVDGIIFGIPNDFLWINKKEIKEIIKLSMSRKANGIHMGCLFIQPLNRCLNGNEKYIWCRDYIQVKWYSLFDDIIDYKNKKYIQEKNSNYYCSNH